MNSEISDVDLRNQLKSHGVIVGPITGTTRKVYLKKLESLKNVQPALSQPQTAKKPEIPASKRSNLDNSGRPTSNESYKKPSPTMTRSQENPPSSRRSDTFVPSTQTTRNSETSPSRRSDTFTVPAPPTRNLSRRSENFMAADTTKKLETPKRFDYNAPDTYSYTTTTTSKKLEIPKKFENFNALDSIRKSTEKFPTMDSYKKPSTENFNTYSSPWSSNSPSWATTSDYRSPRRWWHLNANTSRLLVFGLFGFLAILAVLYGVILNQNKVKWFGKVLFGALLDTGYFVYNHMILPALLLSIVGVIIFGVFWYRKYKTHKAAEEQRQVFEMVEKILTLLKKHDEECAVDSSRQPYMAVPHVRDALIPITRRKDLMPIWNKAVQYLNENESRVRTENQIISGEEFMVWRWLQVGGAGVDEKVWQGHAFPEDQVAMNMPSTCYFECLKLRGLFDPDLEEEDDWPEHIQDAILEKLGSSIRVMHVAIDTESKEGCVYIKFGSKEEAGAAYKILHGSWFNGRLVTVKYLRPERYHERFPEATRCIYPLRVKKPRYSLLG